MFTGLIEATGRIVSIVPSAHAAGPVRLTVSAPGMASRLRTGDSIAVSGVCLTALDISSAEFSADLAAETVQRTKLARLEPGAVVNLELPTPAGSPMGGHVVQGHVDGVGELLSLEAIDPLDKARSDWRLRVRVPTEISKYVAAQGSITVEGISLTVADVTGDVVSIAIIPHTYGATSLHTLGAGSPVNIEVDVLAKYAEKQMAGRSGWSLTEEYLLANG
jgi:riboflavin synthase